MSPVSDGRTKMNVVCRVDLKIDNGVEIHVKGSRFVMLRVGNF